MNNRRRLLVALGAAALASPLTPHAQSQTKVWRVGFFYLGSRQSELDTGRSGAFLHGMRELGYIEGKNLAIVWRFADGKAERLPGLAAELVQMKVDLILAAGTQATSAAQKATATIPIVMGTAGDPVGSGFVKTLARPGGNITGLSTITDELGPKHLEMLIAMVPKLSRVAFLMNPVSVLYPTVLKNVQAAAQRAGVKILLVEAQTPQQIENAFPMMAREGAGAIIVVADGLFAQQRLQIAELALKNRLPSIAWIQEFAEAGVLMSYGPNFADLYRRSATYVDKILKGAKPGELPVEQAMKFDLFINGKTVKALDLTIPPSLLISATKVIE